MRLLRARLTVAICVIVTALAGLGQAQTAPPPNLKERFKAADKNSDGRLDREEYHQLIVEAFYFRDKDKDSMLTIAELEGVLSPEVFGAANRKANGKLSMQEWTNALFVDFARADTNGDGVLTVEEIEAYIRAAGR